MNRKLTLRPLFLSLLFFALLGLLAGGTVLWVESPGGARALSSWVTARVEQQAPGTAVTFDRIRLRWPLTAEVNSVRWGRPGQPPILGMGKVKLSAWSWGWSQEGRVDRLDLAALDQTLAQGKWKAAGFLAGPVRFKGNWSGVQEMDFELETQAPGGTLSSEILQRLLNLMPKEPSSGGLLQAIGSGPTFHFNVGRIQAVTEGDVYRFSFLLDGDHLLDVTLRVSKESLGTVTRLVNQGG